MPTPSEPCLLETSSIAVGYIARSGHTPTALFIKPSFRSLDPPECGVECRVNVRVLRSGLIEIRNDIFLDTVGWVAEGPLSRLRSAFLGSRGYQCRH